MTDTPNKEPAPVEVAAEFLKKQSDLTARCPQAPDNRHRFRNNQCYYCQLYKP